MNTSGPELPMTVFIVDDDRSICDSMMNLLDSEGIPASPYQSTEDFFKSWKHDMRGCLLLDVRLPGMTGIEFQEKLLQAKIRIPIIFMTAFGDVPTVRRVMKAGAVEFLTKPFQKEELLTAVRQAFQQDAVQRLETALRNIADAGYTSLTAREREVMALVTAGLPNREIAQQLGVSVITIKLHRRHVMEKMGAASLADLVRSSEVLKKTTYTKG